MDESSIPYGYCHCGCGQKTVVSDVTSHTRGYVKGEPKKWKQGHGRWKGRGPTIGSRNGPCSKCGRIREYRRGRWCSECVARYNEEYHRTRREALLEYTRRYWEANREAINARRRSSYRENPEPARKRARQWREDNPDRSRVNDKAWRELNRDKRQEAEARRRAAKRGAKITQEAPFVRQMYDDQSGLCAYCEAPLFGTFHIDHMTPLSRGGGHDEMNLALTCGRCNLRKHDKTLEEYFMWLSEIFASKSEKGKSK